MTEAPEQSVSFEHTRTVEVKRFQVPNFAVPVGKAGDPEREGIPIKALPREALDELAMHFLTDLYAKAQRRPPDLKYHPWEGSR